VCAVGDCAVDPRGDAVTVLDAVEGRERRFTVKAGSEPEASSRGDECSDNCILPFCGTDGDDDRAGEAPLACAAVAGADERRDGAG
jgi:hypothetical protein